MNTEELVSHLRVNILDDRGGSGVADWGDFADEDTSSIQLRWGNEELIRNINEAITLVYRRTTPAKDMSTIAVVAGTSVYNLPIQSLEVLLAKLSNGKALGKTDVESLWNNQAFFTDTAEPRFYIPDMAANTITLYPKPNKNDTLTYMYYRLPLVPLSWNTLTAQPELRIEFQLPMLFYAAHLCYMRDEANTIDPNRARYYLSLFDAEFPPLSSYGAMRKSKTSNRAINYGGLNQPSYGKRTGLNSGSTQNSGY
jgi:hypothetical protein